MSTRKLLLADDSITIQKVVNLTFADEGIEVISVGNGDEAMEKMAEAAPDLVMADVNMPGLNGYQVCERIKTDENFKRTPVILLVGSFEPFNEDEARRVGADDFLTKPFQSIRQLVSKVTVLLEANDQNSDQLREATANNSFADTLDMNVSEISDSDQANDLGDAGMDDEMIETNPVNSFALDESAKFETKDFVSDEDPEDYKRTQPLSVYDLKEFSFVADAPERDSEPQYSETFAENDTANISTSEIQGENENILSEGRNQEPKGENFSAFFNSSDDDLLEIPFDEDDEWDAEETGETSTEAGQVSDANEEEKPEEQFAGGNCSLIEELPQPESSEEAKTQETDASLQTTEHSEETSPDESASDLQNQEFEEKVLTENADETYQKDDFETVSAEPEEDYRGENEIVVGNLVEPEKEEIGENYRVSGGAEQFSPELIDAVARRVVEMLSDKVVREIAWEVVPQHADLVIKKAVEEKLAGEKLTE